VLRTPGKRFQRKNQFRTPRQITGCSGHLVRYVFVPIYLIGLALKGHSKVLVAARKNCSFSLITRHVLNPNTISSFQIKPHQIELEFGLEPEHGVSSSIELKLGIIEFESSSNSISRVRSSSIKLSSEQVKSLFSTNNR
jgi:hypothetical protein